MSTIIAFIQPYPGSPRKHNMTLIEIKEIKTREDKTHYSQTHYDLERKPKGISRFIIIINESLVKWLDLRSKCKINCIFL